ncbi:MAG: type I glyceraldehyde-3-phosphate dehydrogenase [Deltaproteobacteria bacterium]|nr:MAG: type I glyceraldehyde-3-phosphate dehydrogenase [Deltaproteobacteria bacterium]
MRVAINGFGRIGRSIYRLLNEKEGFEVVAVNDLADPAALAYLLNHDTVMGNFEDSAIIEDGEMVTGHQRTKMLSERDPAKLPWRELGVDYVIEATGVFRDLEKAALHLDAGAGRVILTVPAKGEVDATVVLGVNEETITPECRVISNASCTTNCMAPVVKILHENFTILSGLMTTVHAYTNDQRLADVPHSDWRRSRAAAENTIPTTTGAARAVGVVLPELKGKLDGMAMRVPIPDGSVVDLVTEVSRDVTVEEVNAAIRSGANSPSMRGVLRYSEGPLVSSDIVGDPHSAIFDAPLTQVIGGRLVKTISWYDNEWGYSNRVVDLIEYLAGL